MAVQSIPGSWCSLHVAKVAAAGGILSGMLRPSKMSCSIAAIMTGGASSVSGLVPWSIATWCNPALMTSIVGSRIGCVLWKMSVGSLSKISGIYNVGCHRTIWTQGVVGQNFVWRVYTMGGGGL